MTLLPCIVLLSDILTRYDTYCPRVDDNCIRYDEQKWIIGDNRPSANHIDIMPLTRKYL